MGLAQTESGGYNTIRKTSVMGQGQQEEDMRKFGGNNIELLDGCREGKHTPRLSEVKCPQCGRWAEVFVLMDGGPGKTGTLYTSEKCECGFVFPEGSHESDYERD